ncbi:MAG: hypothetical protein ABJH63_09250 [Rhizobiaceae bacterium]
MQQFDPLDPEHRAERGRERTAFFRQTDMFPLVVLAMVVFVPLAMWQKPWALPFLGWMAFMTHIVGGVDRLAASTAKGPWTGGPLLAGSTLRTALACVVLFFVLVIPFSTSALLYVGALLVLLYIYGILSGRLVPQGDGE